MILARGAWEGTGKGVVMTGAATLDDPLAPLRWAWRWGSVGAGSPPHRLEWRDD